VDVDLEPPHGHHHHANTGNRWLDLALPVAALFVSFVSILIAWHHGKVMKELVHQNERLVQANSLPWLELSGRNASPEGGRYVAFTAANRGVGPAEIRSMEVTVDGRPVSNLSELLKACCTARDYSGLTTSTLLGRMLRPGEEVNYISLKPTAATIEAATQLDEARQKNRIAATLCYCSVFDECWTATSTGAVRPVTVKQCPVPKTQYAQ
jgi:hypothetical protein